MIRYARQFPALLVLAGLTLVYFVAPPAPAAKRGPSGKTAQPADTVEPCKTLPVPVRDMREAILAAVQTGDIKQLLVPIQWNELPPDFGGPKNEEPIAYFKKQSIDGEGREILAILGNMLSVPCVAVREGPDIENNKVYVWPYFARLSFAALKPTDKVVALSVIPREAFAQMKASGQYAYWSIRIGADGTWHSFKLPESKQ